MTIQSTSVLRSSCECGTCRCDAHTLPKARFICHCTICQTFTGQAFSDVSVFRAADISLTNADQIVFKKYRSPPNINRGLCRQCGKPALEAAGSGPFKILFVPTPNFEQCDLLPPVRMHVFYNRRLADADDALPKHSGYFRSQIAIGRLLMKGL
jgi:hypothetical protein